ncbi:MAG: hypothetical protein BIFFINMI_03123 [Phycisphaerae bacterium]|nr:hypothetical protein [Phycisphaerae bacterium]
MKTLTWCTWGLLAAACLLQAAPLHADDLSSQRKLMGPPKSLTPADDPPPPQFTADEKACLVKLARQAVDFSASTGRRYQARDVPGSLRGRDEVTYVTCRMAGRMVGSIAGEGRDIPSAICQAAEFIVGAKEFAAGYRGDKMAAAQAATIELEILGPGQILHWKILANISNTIAPGIHGVAARLKRTNDNPQEDPLARTKWMKPSVAIVHGYTGAQMVDKLLENAGWLAPQILAHHDQVEFYRFQAVHLIEWKNDAGYAELFRGAQTVPASNETREHLTALIGLIGDHMINRQLKSGLFGYLYRPRDGHYASTNNGTRQAAAAWAMACAANATSDPRYGLACLNAIDAAELQYVNDNLNVAAAVYPTIDVPVTRPDGSKAPAPISLGQSALLTLAILDVPGNKELTPIRDKLAAGLLAQQRLADATDDDKKLYGSFKCYYNDFPDGNNAFYFSGETLLALMRLHQVTQDKRYLDAVERSFDYYRKLFEGEQQKTLKQAMTAWHQQAWALAWEVTGKKQYADFVFEMGDFQLSFQANEANAPYPDMVGGFLNESNSAGIGSGVYLEGLAAACRIARKIGDDQQAKKCEYAIRIGARFVDQLTFKGPDTFYCISPAEAIGGVKFSLENDNVRIDNNQHALCALLAIRELLYPQQK